MTVHHPTLEDSLNQELRRWLHRVLGDVLALPRVDSAHECSREAIMHGLEQVRRSLEAVRLYVTECDEIGGWQQLSPLTVSFASLVRDLCHSLEEEVNSVEDDLLTYAS